MSRSTRMPYTGRHPVQPFCAHTSGQGLRSPLRPGGALFAAAWHAAGRGGGLVDCREVAGVRSSSYSLLAAGRILQRALGERLTSGWCRHPLAEFRGLSAHANPHPTPPALARTATVVGIGLQVGAVPGVLVGWVAQAGACIEERGRTQVATEATAPAQREALAYARLEPLSSTSAAKLLAVGASGRCRHQPAVNHAWSGEPGFRF